MAPHRFRFGASCRVGKHSVILTNVGVNSAEGCSRRVGLTPSTVALSRKPKRGLLLRYASVALPGQTFILPIITVRWRAGFVRTGATLANTMVPALTSRALLAKREVNATGLGGTPVLLGMLRPVSSAPTRGLQRADAARHHRVLLRRLALCAVDGLDGSGGKFREGKWGAGLAGFEISLKFRYEEGL